jgi:hypothetical protein
MTTPNGCFLESMETVAFAWGEENFGEVYGRVLLLLRRAAASAGGGGDDLRPGKTTHRA